MLTMNDNIKFKIGYIK